MSEAESVEAAANSVLGKRLRLCSAGLENLSIADLALPSYVLEVLDCSSLKKLDVSGCRRVRVLPQRLPCLELLNISYCKELEEDAVREVPLLKVLIARGNTGKFKETLPWLIGLQNLEKIDWLQRVFLKPWLIWSNSMLDMICSHVKHVGGLISGLLLRHAEFHGSDLLTSFSCHADHLTQEVRCALACVVLNRALIIIPAPSFVTIGT